MSSKRPDPGRVAVPVVQRLHIRYAKHGRMRFASHRDFQRALERALRRAQVPVAMSAGFSPHPRISYANSAPTGSASWAEYVEIALTQPRDPDDVRQRVSNALPAGFDLVTVVVATDRDLPNRLEASVWQIELPQASLPAVQAAMEAFLAADEVMVERLMKDGIRRFDARGAVTDLRTCTELIAVDPRISDIDDISADAAPESGTPCVILSTVVRHVTPAVRPDDLLTALRQEGELDLPVPARVTRVAQGPLGADQRSVLDPLSASDVTVG